MKLLGIEVLSEPSIVAQFPEIVDVATLAGGISIFVPLVVSFITKKEASDRVKAVTNLLAVAVASVVALFMRHAGEPITWQLVGSTFMAGLVSSIVAYKAGWKPVGVSPAIENATPNLGFGSNKDEVTQ